jgi:hypothetical protein
MMPASAIQPVPQPDKAPDPILEKPSKAETQPTEEKTPIPPK